MGHQTALLQGNVDQRSANRGFDPKTFPWSSWGSNFPFGWRIIQLATRI